MSKKLWFSRLAAILEIVLNKFLTKVDHGMGCWELSASLSCVAFGECLEPQDPLVMVWLPRFMVGSAIMGGADRGGLEVNCPGDM